VSISDHFCDRAKAEDQAWVAVSQFYNSYQASVKAEHDRRRQSMASAKAKGKQRATAADFEDWLVEEHELPQHFRGSEGIGLAKRLLSERLSSSEDDRIRDRVLAVEDTVWWLPMIDSAL
jgi:kinetochore protein Mis13/DSN1